MNASASVAKTGELENRPSIFRTVETVRSSGLRIPQTINALPHAIREGRMVIGPDLAAWILRDAAFDGQRKSAKHHVTLVAHLMKDGRWSAGSQIAFCDLDGSLYLTNGKHRMNAVIASGTAQEFQVLITHCRSMREVEADYYRHDTTARKRSVSEIIGSTQMGRESGLPKALMESLYSAAPMVNAGLQFRHYESDPTSRDVDAKISAAAEWLPEARKFAEFTSPAGAPIRQKLFNVGVLAVALMTIRHQPRIAEDFWGGLAKDDGLRRNDPRKALLIDLASRNTGKGPYRARILPAAIAWSAFFDSRPLHHIKVMDSTQLRIAGTPINGRTK